MLPDDTDPMHSTTPLVPGLEVLDVVARGGHGTVYLARQQEHDRLVALKVLDARFADDATRRRFDRERTALGRLSDHPAIVSLLDSGFTEGGAPYLILEYAPGGSLADRIDAGPVGIDEATRIVIGLAAAIEETHAAGVVHRDIKPANVLRSAYGEWMLGDFGIATIVDRSATSAVHVSYAHTAPETFDGDGATPAADIYSLASVLATCLTGAEPFEMAPEETPLAVMQRVLHDPYPDLRRSGVPDDLAVLLEMALSKDPAQRPMSARAFAAALNGVRRNHGLPERPIRVGGTDVGHTVAVDAATVPDPAPSWAHAPIDGEPTPTRRRGRILAFAASFLFTILALLVALPAITGEEVGDQPVVADVIQVVFDGDAADDGDGPGNGNGGGGDGPGNGGNGGRGGRGGNGNGPGGGGNGGGGNGNGGNGGGGGN